MELFAVLDATHYPIAIFKDQAKAHDYVAKHPDRFALYVVRTRLAD